MREGSWRRFAPRPSRGCCRKRWRSIPRTRLRDQGPVGDYEGGLSDLRGRRVLVNTAHDGKRTIAATYAGQGSEAAFQMVPGTWTWSIAPGTVLWRWLHGHQTRSWLVEYGPSADEQKSYRGADKRVVAALAAGVAAFWLRTPANSSEPPPPPPTALAEPAEPPPPPTPTEPVSPPNRWRRRPANALSLNNAPAGTTTRTPEQSRAAGAAS